MVPSINARVGRLVVLRVFRTERSRQGRTLIDCICDCGTSVTVTANNIGRGTLSCGCLMRERGRAANTTHGQSRTKEHVAWLGARGRCLNPKDEAFRSYGGRGITMSPEWAGSFGAFLRDMGPCPSGGTLDRVDNDGPYTKGNCEWRTPKQQANNRRSNHRVSFNGLTLTIAEWADRTGLGYEVIKQRLGKLGWTAERALTTPVGTRVAA